MDKIEVRAMLAEAVKQGIMSTAYIGKPNARAKVWFFIKTNIKPKKDKEKKKEK